MVIVIIMSIAILRVRAHTSNEILTLVCELAHGWLTDARGPKLHMQETWSFDKADTYLQGKWRGHR